MADFASEMANMMWQIYQRQLDREQTDQTLMNQIGGYMLNTVLGQRMYDESQRKMFKEYMPYSEAMKAGVELFKNNDMAGIDTRLGKIAEMVPGFRPPSGLSDLSALNEQALNALKEYEKGVDVEGIGKAAKYVRPEDFAKGAEYYGQNVTTSYDLLMAELRAKEIEAGGNSSKATSLTAAREFAVRASNEAQRYIDYFSAGKAGQKPVIDDPALEEKINAVKSKIEDQFKKNPEMMQFVMGDKERWFSHIGVEFFSELKEYVDKIAAKTLTSTAGPGGAMSPEELNFITEAQNPAALYDKFSQLDEWEYDRIVKFHNKIKPKIDELMAFSSRPGTMDPIFGSVIEKGAGFMLPDENKEQLAALIEADRLYYALPRKDESGATIPGNPGYLEQYHRMLWEKLIYGQSSVLSGDQKTK